MKKETEGEKKYDTDGDEFFCRQGMRVPFLKANTCIFISGRILFSMYHRREKSDRVYKGVGGSQHHFRDRLLWDNPGTRSRIGDPSLSHVFILLLLLLPHSNA